MPTLPALEPDSERQLKYLDFTDIYAALDENERQRYQRDYPEEAETMSHFAERFHAQGMQQGMQRGEAAVLLHQLRRKFGDLPDETCRRIEGADADTLLFWSERILTAESIEEILH